MKLSCLLLQAGQLFSTPQIHQTLQCMFLRRADRGPTLAATLFYAVQLSKLHVHCAGQTARLFLLIHLIKVMALVKRQKLSPSLLGRFEFIHVHTQI